MVALGYALSSEEHTPQTLAQNARRAEEVGFEFASISDHFHPWISEQGHSPFVWAVLGAISQTTSRLKVFTGVTCPLIRIHPVIIAQAAATVASMMPDRFMLGIGTGENLNEHVTGEAWPPFGLRLEMLEEAIHILRMMWQGGLQTHYGTFYDVVNAELFTLPDKLPLILIAASGIESAEVAGRFGDGLINTSPDAKVVKAFQKAGNKSLPRYGQVTVCWAKDEKTAVKTAHKLWPIAGFHGPLNQELAIPDHFEQAAKGVSEEAIAENIICGNDVNRHLEAIQKYMDAGYDHVYIHQVGSDQEGFFKFYEKNVLPEFQRTRAKTPA